MLMGFEDVPYHFRPIGTDGIVLADWWGLAALVSTLSLFSGLLLVEAEVSNGFLPCGFCGFWGTGAIGSGWSMWLGLEGLVPCAARE